MAGAPPVRHSPVIPAQAGIQQSSQRPWVPAFAGTNGSNIRNRMRGTMRRKLLLAAVAATLLASPALAQDKVKLRYGQIAASARSVSSLALNIAQRKGFLTRENIDLEVVGLRGVQYQIEELDKGTVDVSHTATPYLIQLVLKGSPSVGIVGGPANTISSLMAKPEIKTYDDLKNKLIGMSLPVDTI